MPVLCCGPQHGTVQSLCSGKAISVCPCLTLYLNHSSQRNGIQVFVHGTFNYFLILDKNVWIFFCCGVQPSGGIFARHQNTLSWPWLRLNTLLLSNSLCRLLCKLCKPNLNTLMYCSSLAVPSKIDTLLSARWCEYNANTVWICLSECVELEEDFCIFCILCIGDFF